MTEEQGALLAKSRESLAAARLLRQSGHSGFAVSRAYYAMFYAAEALLLGEGLKYSKHSAVAAAFGLHFSRTARVPAELHRYLIEGMGSRQVADYATTQLSDDESQEQIRRAESFLAAAEQVLSTQP